MTRSTCKGFGYVTSRWVQEDNLSLSSDSNLSSTSLLKNLIEPSSSEESFLTRDIEDSKLAEVRESVRQSISYLRQTEDVQSQGLNIDYEELRKKDEERHFEKQSIPILSEKSRRLLAKNFRFTDTPTMEDLTIPLMAQLRLRSRSQIWKRKPSGLVGELVGFMESNPVPDFNRRRSVFLRLVKEQLDDENEEQEVRADETEEEKKLREEKEAEHWKNEEEVFNRHSEREKMVIKKTLGRVPNLRKSVYIPFGKEGILSSTNPNSEEFFKQDISPRPSYDEYYSNKEDFGSTRVFPSVY